MIDLRQGDCLEVMRTLPDESVHACVTDPPYGLAFMGKKWDYDVPTEEVWREVLRVLKPGGFLLSFSGTRTYHRMVVRIEDAGFEIRDMIQWIYGSGFPKSHDVSKAIDREAGAEREVVGRSPHSADRKVGTLSAGNEQPSGYNCGNEGERYITAPATDAAKQWDGWGSALKPANEPICVARKPLIGTIAQNVLAHECGGLNIDACRIQTEGESLNGGATHGSYGRHEGWRRPWMQDPEKVAERIADSHRSVAKSEALGRWPANVVHDGSDEATRGMGESSRYFYTAKADQAERDKGVSGIEKRQRDEGRKEGNPGGDNPRNRGLQLRGNHHPTVKPVDLMRWLVRLVCAPGGVVLDPFMGSGTTGVACRLEGFGFIGIDRDEDYVRIARGRIDAETPSLFA